MSQRSPAGSPPRVVLRVDDLPDVRRPYDPDRDRERWRGRLAGGLVVLVALTIGASFLWLALDLASAEEVTSLLDKFLTPLIALTGTALGFYFGGTKQS